MQENTCVAEPPWTQESCICFPSRGHFRHHRSGPCPVFGGGMDLSPRFLCRNWISLLTLRAAMVRRNSRHLTKPRSGSLSLFPGVAWKGRTFRGCRAFGKVPWDLSSICSTRVPTETAHVPDHTVLLGGSSCGFCVILRTKGPSGCSSTPRGGKECPEDENVGYYVSNNIWPWRIIKLCSTCLHLSSKKLIPPGHQLCLKSLYVLASQQRFPTIHLCCWQ